MTMPRGPIEERTAEGKRAYAQGFKAGWEAALRGLRKGMSAQQVEDMCMTIQTTIDGLSDARITRADA